MSAEQFFWGLAIIAVLAVVGWLAMEAVHAPTEVEPTPLDDLMDGPAEHDCQYCPGDCDEGEVGDDTLDMVYGPRVTAPPEALKFVGPNGACTQCSGPGTRVLPYAMTSEGVPVEEFLCREHGELATQPEAEWPGLEA